MSVKVQVIEIAQMNELVNAVNGTRVAVETMKAAMEANGFPDQISVKELASSGEMSDLTPTLKMGTEEMKLFFSPTNDHLFPYPEELQPVIVPEVNEIKYYQLAPSGNLYHISGTYKATGVQQVSSQTLADYNTANGTTFAADTTKFEFLEIPLMRLPGTTVTLDSDIDHRWENVGNENETEWLEPKSAISRQNSNVIKLVYNEGDNRYPLIFGDDLTWDINISFSGVIEAYFPE